MQQFIRCRTTSATRTVRQLFMHNMTMCKHCLTSIFAMR